MAAPAQVAQIITDQGAAIDGPYSVSGSCSAVAGAITGFNEITYVAEAEGHAADVRWTQVHLEGSRDGSAVPPPEHFVPDAAGVVTAVTCEVVDDASGVVYGRIARGLPGPTAVAVGEVVVPTSALVHARVCVSAIFPDGTSVSTC